MMGFGFLSMIALVALPVVLIAVLVMQLGKKK